MNMHHSQIWQKFIYLAKQPALQVALQYKTLTYFTVGL